MRAGLAVPPHKKKGQSGGGARSLVARAGRPVAQLRAPPFAYGRWRRAARRGMRRDMAPSPRSPSAGGFPIALGALGGTAVGLYTGQPSIGFLAGLAVGVALALLIWWRDR
jgi:hypothetical protein